MKTLVVPMIMLSRIENGIDYSVPRKLLVLVAHSEKRLTWIRGFTGWVSRGARGYYPGVLECIGPDERGRFKCLGTQLQEGGRLNKKSLGVLKEKIAKELEIDVKDLDQLDSKTTLIIGKSVKSCQKALEKYRLTGDRIIYCKCHHISY